MVCAASSVTTLFEIVVTSVKEFRPYYRIVRKWQEGTWSVLTDRYRFPVPNEHDLADYLVFAGHNLPINVYIRVGHWRHIAPFNFHSADPDALKLFIQQHCLNRSLPHEARIRVFDARGSQEDCIALFPPDRELWGKNLFQEREVLPGIYFAIGQEGDSVLHDGKYCLAMAYCYSSGESNYRVQIHGEILCGGKKFVRNRYRSQKAANNGLLFHANRLHQLRKESSGN